MLFCCACRKWVDKLEPPNDGDDVMKSHIDAYHRIYHCLLCRQATVFKGRGAVLQHLLEKHCKRLCHFPGCGYQPGVPDADDPHMDEAHVEYQIFMLELYSSQEQGSTAVQGESGEPVDKPDDQDDNHTDEPDNDYGEASGVVEQESGDDPGVFVMQNNCLIWRQNRNASGSM